MPPGGWRRYRADGRIEEGIYWSPPAYRRQQPIERMPSFDDAVDELDEKLQRAAAFTLRSDVPVGIFLSAGIDSSLVARAAVKAGTIARAFSLGFEEQSHSEVPGARQTAAQARAADHRSDAQRVGARAIHAASSSHADDPLADSSALAVWTLAAETAKHVKVVLAGDGGDELFGGYLTYPATLWHASVTSRLPSCVRRAMAAAGAQIGGGDGKVTTSYKLMRYLARGNPSAWRSAFQLERHLAAGRGRGDRRASGSQGVGAQLVAMDVRASRSHGRHLARIAAARGRRAITWSTTSWRNPIACRWRTDSRCGRRFSIASWPSLRLRLPAHFKAGRRGPGKRILRALARRTYGPEMATAAKQGFSIPVHEWLRGPARPLVDDLLVARRRSPACSLLEGPIVDACRRRSLVGQARARLGAVGTDGAGGVAPPADSARAVCRRRPAAGSRHDSIRFLKSAQQSREDPEESEVHDVGVEAADDRGPRAQPPRRNRGRSSCIDSRAMTAHAAHSSSNVMPPITPHSARRPSSVECGSISL